jgi:hypothetical protein
LRYCARPRTDLWLDVWALEVGTLPYAEGLLLAMNAHSLDAMVACFADDYVNEWPAHHSAASKSRRRNWSRIFAGVPDLRARLPRMPVLFRRRVVA